MTTDPLPHLATLGLELGASREDVKRAYRDLSKVWHPDRFTEDPKLQRKAEDQLKAINDAYQHLRSYEPALQSERWPAADRPTPGRNMGERILRPRIKFHPTERLPLVITLLAILVALLLVVTAI